MTQPASAVPESGQYEFTPTHDVVFRGVARSMGFVGAVTFLLNVLVGGLAALTQLLEHDDWSVVAWIVVAVMNAFIGGWLLSASRSFRAVADTQHHDIDNLMNAMRHLRRVYAVQMVTIIAGLLLVAIAMVLGISLRPR